MTDSYVTYELDGDIALIGINRPSKRNALSSEAANQLIRAAERAGLEARAGVIFGHGDHFSAGLDLVDMGVRRRAGVSDDQKRDRHEGHQGFDAIARGRIPFVAALRGAVIGYGLELAAAAQIRVADRTTYFGLPEAMRGIFVGGGGSVRIQRLLGYARMADMMLTRRILSAEEGHGLNLCQYLVEPDEALEKAKELARTISENVALSNWTICNVLPRMFDLGQDDGFMLEQMAAHYTFGNESQERLDQFARKQGPRFK
ncbi:crotonase/enoyl-CoA hydratase family protein [Sphingobium sp.]|uniref:crotonase/enoyl-CoA hydratase family protein n=1 Tax=Sphingobium sp. TaxID=1912891 RepID=UPI0028BDEF2D|nr:crotonase/enoyl-CoA hydratase family protein [Sphingobium sp.]